MTRTFTNVSAALPQLAAAVMAGKEVGTRQGDRAMELLHEHIVLTRPWEREVVTPGRRASLPAQIAETMWVLAGRNDVEWLSHYLPRAADFSDDGTTWRGGYGPRIRHWDEGSEDMPRIDQLAHVVNLLREDPLTRRAVINIYDPAMDTAPGKDIPCNNWLHFISREGHLDLHVATRSNDLIWGWSGINAFEWSVLQEIVAGLLGLRIGELHFSITSLHVYDRHWKKAQKLADLDQHQAVVDSSEPRFDGSVVHNYPSMPEHPVAALDALIRAWFALEEQIRTGSKPLAYLRREVNCFPEPMMRGWLRVLLFWWGPDNDLDVGPGLSKRAIYATMHSPGYKVCAWPAATSEPAPEPDEFAQFASDLHAEKSAAYGDSWKRRGEQIGIMANIARKVDRLGVAGGGDTSADTAVDLLIYLIKYDRWLKERQGGTVAEENLYVSRALHRTLDMTARGHEQAEINRLKSDFDDLERQVTRQHGAAYKRDTVSRMAAGASALARRLWADEREAASAAVLGHAERNATRSWDPETDEHGTAGY